MHHICFLGIDWLSLLQLPDFEGIWKKYALEILTAECWRSSNIWPWLVELAGASWQDVSGAYLCCMRTCFVDTEQLPLGFVPDWWS